MIKLECGNDVTFDINECDIYHYALFKNDIINGFTYNINFILSYNNDCDVGLIALDKSKKINK